MLRLTRLKSNPNFNTSLLYRDDPELASKKVLKTNEHFLKVKIDSEGREITPDDAEFYKKVKVSIKSTGYRSLTMQKQIAKIEKYYLTRRKYPQEEIVQQVKEYDVGMRHLVNSLGIEDQEKAKKFLELNSYSEEAERSIMDYYFPTTVKEVARHEIKNPKMRLSKFQLEQILYQSEADEADQEEAPRDQLDLLSEENTKTIITEENKMVQVKHYTDPNLLSSKDLLYKIADKIYNLDELMKKLQKDRFKNSEASQELHQLVDDSIKFRPHLRSFDWRSAKDFETLERIDTLSIKAYQQIIEELERLVDHPLFYKEAEFVVRMSEAVLEEDDKDGQGGQNNHQNQISTGRDRDDFDVEIKNFEKYNLSDGRVLKNVDIIFAKGVKDKVDTCVCDVKLIPVQGNTNKDYDVLNTLIMVNGQNHITYFPHIMDRLESISPLNLLNKLGHYHIEAQIYGGPMNDDHYHGFTWKGRENRKNHKKIDSATLKNAIARALYKIGSEDERRALEMGSVIEYDDRTRERFHLGRGFDGARKNRKWKRR